MKISLHKNFTKNFKKRIKKNPKLLKKFRKRYNLFVKNRNNKLLYDHKLSGELKGLRSFSITGDIRIVYKEIGKVSSPNFWTQKFNI